MDLLEQELGELQSTFKLAGSKIAGQIFSRPTAATPSIPEENRDTAAPATESPDSAIKLACARELVRLNVITPTMASAMVKSASISPDQARRSLDRLDSLERSKPTLGQVGRYGMIGGLGGAAIGAVGNAIEGGSALKGATPKAKMLNVAANAAKGALGGGALPLLRAHSDRHAEMGTLRKYMNQEGR